MQTDYLQQATDFLAKNRIEYHAHYIGKDVHFEGETEKRDRYICSF